MHTLLFQLGALGDWVLTFPTLRAINGPKLAVTQWSRAQLAERLIADVRPVDIDRREFTRLFSEGGPAAMGPDVEAMFEQASLLISFISDGGDAWAANARRLAPQAHHVFVAPRPPSGFDGHVVTWHHQQMRQQGLDLPSPAIPLDGPDASGEAPAGLRPTPRAGHDGPVVIHPGSGGLDKCWPLERFMDLAQHLSGLGRTVAFLTGHVERERVSESQMAQLGEVGEVHTPSDPVGICELLESASGFIGNDSGPAHLAAQMGLPTLVLFGPSNPRQWCPIGPAVRPMVPPAPRAMDWLEVDAVIEAAEKTLP